VSKKISGFEKASVSSSPPIGAGVFLFFVEIITETIAEISAKLNFFSFSLLKGVLFW